MDLVLLLLANFWAWETLRYALENYVETLFTATRPLHPLVVAALPLFVLWPEWVAALGVAGATALAVALADRWLTGTRAQPVTFPRRRGGLNPLP